MNDRQINRLLLTTRDEIKRKEIMHKGNSRLNFGIWFLAVALIVILLVIRIMKETSDEDIIENPVRYLVFGIALLVLITGAYIHTEVRRLHNRIDEVVFILDSASGVAVQPLGNSQNDAAARQRDTPKNE
jgi:hypothetical protein